MVFAALTSSTNVWVGNSDYLQPLAALNPGSTPDDRWIRSMGIAGSTATSEEPTLGSVGYEAIVNQYTLQISADVLYGAGPKALTARQDLTDNVMAIVFLDTMTHYVIPCTWTGQPINNPTDNVITVPMTFLQTGEVVDGAAVSGKTRVKAFTDVAGGTTSTGFASVNAGDRVWLLVTDFEGTAETFTLTNSSSTEISEDVSVSQAGIYEVPVLAGQTYGDLMQLKYSGTSSDKISGYLLAGPLMTID